MLQGATVTNATLSGSSLVVPTTQGQAGTLYVHDATQSATITASWLYNATATSPVNSTTSAAIYRTGTLQLAANTFDFAPSLNHLIISPGNATPELPFGGGDLNLFLTGFYDDETVRDLSKSKGTQWEVYVETVDANGNSVTTGPATGVTFLGNVLQFKATFKYYGNLIVVARNGGRTAITQCFVIPPP